MKTPANNRAYILVDSFKREGVEFEVKKIEGKDGLEYVGLRNLPDRKQVILGTHIFNEAGFKCDRESVIKDITSLVNKKYSEHTK